MRVAYIFAVVSALLATYNIFVCAKDFFDPEGLSFQLLNLSYSQVLVLDAVVIAVYLLLLFNLFRWIERRKPVKIILTSMTIIVFTIAQLILENAFRHNT